MSYETPTRDEFDRRSEELAAAEEAADHARRDGDEDQAHAAGYEAHCLTEALEAMHQARNE